MNDAIQSLSKEFKLQEAHFRACIFITLLVWVEPATSGGTRKAVGQRMVRNGSEAMLWV